MRWIAISMLALLLACSNNKVEDVDHPMGGEGFYSGLKKKVEESARPTGTGLGVMLFDQDEHDFGTITEGEIVTHIFTYTNTGEGPLSITDIESRCGCTIPKWTRKPIMPGEKGEIEVVFDSSKRTEKQAKAIIVYTNGQPYKSALVIRAYVEPKEN
jgi:hypothetical protein